MRLAVAISIAACLSGCPDPSPPPEPSPVPAPTKRAPPEPSAPAPVRPRPEHAATVRRVEAADGTPVASGGYRAGQPLMPGARIESGEHRVVIDFVEEGGRVEIEPGSRVVIGEEELPSTVILGRGAVHAILAPIGNAVRRPMRIATSQTTVIIGGSGEVFVRVGALPCDRAWVTDLGGIVEVAQGDADDEGRPVRLTLGPGQAFRGQVPLVEGAHTLEEARRAPPSPNRPNVRCPPTSLVPLDVALAAVEAEETEGEQLKGRHREAAAARSPQVQTLLTEIVRHAQRIERRREVARVLYERARASALAGGTSSDPALERRPTFRARMGLAAPPLPAPDAPSAHP